ncbi:hypothetical protein OPT61_g7387 [Boeremia exigua]|uniref:Uncharacterized protein n=1 Tax=Boeremia exigua TaxID=749465 RepID=A0ACC2I2P2_9PLEO|nr:hypothetical protein OPT61_g7387 [Boeremia exigua]
MPEVKAQIQKALTDNAGRKVHVLFAGHSAGDAVASLLFCHFATYGLPVPQTQSDTPTVSCITFGAAPMFDKNITPFLQSEEIGNVLSFVNEGDPVPMIDAEYAHQLGTLYSQVSGSICMVAEAEKLKFKPKNLSLRGIGQLVILFDKNADNDSEEEELVAARIDHAYLEKCFWGHIYRHDMDLYLSEADLIEKGTFNGKHGWDSRTWFAS